MLTLVFPLRASQACSFLKYDDEGNPLLETIKPMVDGGTEGFKGHARVLLPGVRFATRQAWRQGVGHRGWSAYGPFALSLPLTRSSPNPPQVTPCFECTLWLFPPQTKYPLCTLAETPRSAPHCIEYAKIAMWPAAFPGVEFDGDNMEVRCIPGVKAARPSLS